LKVSIGIDGADSPRGGCTTHTLYRLFKELVKEGYVERVLDYPYLVRLNPSVPFKTRGNGAVALKFELRKDPGDLVPFVVGVIEKYLREFSGNVDDVGLAIVYGDYDRELSHIYYEALTDYVHRSRIEGLVEGSNGRLALPMGLSRGCVGAIAAIGWSASKFTYELLVYRSSYLTPREALVDLGKLASVDLNPRYRTFCSFDPEVGRVVAIPRGPDPVILGLRGLDPGGLIEALEYLGISKYVEGWIIFKTNQATGEHYVPRASRDMKPFRTGCIAGEVTSVRSVVGGDVELKVDDGFGSLVAYVFKETGLSKVARSLVRGDVVRLCGTVKYWEGVGGVLHVELLEVIDIAELHVKRNPRCPSCGARLKSAGRDKGFKCVKCGYKTKELKPSIQLVGRDISRGFYVPSCGGAKHLTIPRPLVDIDTHVPVQTLVGRISDFY
jgi:tRNA(Ile2)-agmatinylcytidine synthase